MTPKIAITHHGPKLAKDQHGPHFSPWPLVVTRLAQLNPSSQLKRNPFHSFMHPVLKVSGVVHIWYYIPLSPFFLRNSMVTFSGPNSMIPKSWSQNPTPILKEDSSAHQFGSPWRLSEDYSRTPTTWPCRSWVGSSIQDYSKGHFSGVLHHFNQFSRHQVLKHPLDNSIGPYR
ncbi:hypothetical protein O181_032921 [Austropuccinia psidii MF-1]|uniref:Uncharacterized protein n=1 Tax=Austropuccinia psidii MF-1 TaxID=1389203 RepID=A0A9Q3D3C6_9BASI|nr:hypothetical protein [Austropuccinia psidii MF-1]